MPKPIVIYHDHCADGFAAMWCFWSHFKEVMEYYPGSYNKPPPDLTNRVVHLVDFSYKKDVFKTILEKASKVILIDHHDTAIQDLYEFKNHSKVTWYCSKEQSGAGLAWDYLVEEGIAKDPIPPLLRYIEDRDLWLFRYEKTRDVLAYLFSFPYDLNIWDSIIKESYDTSKLETYELLGKAINRKYQKDLKETLQIVKRKAVIGGHHVPIANLPYYMNSDGASELAKGYPFAAAYQDTDKGRQFSLRSVKGDPAAIHVGMIAWKYGGGGHEHAAGFMVNRDHELAKI